MPPPLPDQDGTPAGEDPAGVPDEPEDPADEPDEPGEPSGGEDDVVTGGVTGPTGPGTGTDSGSGEDPGPPSGGGGPGPGDEPTGGGEDAGGFAQPPGRSGFSASLAGFSDISTSPEDVAAHVAVAAGLVLMVVFPAMLVEKTLEENYDDIREWNVVPRRAKARFQQLSERPSRLTFLGFVAAAAAIYGFLDPTFGFNRGSLMTFLGLAVGLLAVIAVLEALTLVRVRKLTGVRGRLKGAPGALAIAVPMVLASRAFDFEPGYVYGVVAAATFSARLDEREEGRTTGLAAFWGGVVAVVAWFAWQPVRDAAADGASLPVFFLDAVLAAIAVAGIEALAFGLLPLRFMDGSKIRRWNPWAWGALLLVGWFGVVHVLLDPSAGLTSTSAAPLHKVAGLFVGFGVFSVLVWGAFRIRAGILERRDADADELPVLVPQQADGAADHVIDLDAAAPDRTIVLPDVPRQQQHRRRLRPRH